MRYQEFEPPPALRPWIASIWEFEVPPGVEARPHTIPLTGGALLGKNLRGGPLLCFGPRLEPLTSVVQGGDRFAGIHFWPGVHRAWLGRDCPPLREVVRPLLGLVDSDWVARFCETLQAGSEQGWKAEGLADIGRALLTRTPNDRTDPAVLAAVLHILQAEGREPVGTLAMSVGLSAATFRRRFRSDVELSPKELARIRRVRASAIDAVAGGNWAGIAVDRGFSDQAHLVREFQELLGRPPESFRAHGELIQHRLLKP